MRSFRHGRSSSSGSSVSTESGDHKTSEKRRSPVAHSCRPVHRRSMSKESLSSSSSSSADGRNSGNKKNQRQIRSNSRSSSPGSSSSSLSARPSSREARLKKSSIPTNNKVLAAYTLKAPTTEGKPKTNIIKPDAGSGHIRSKVVRHPSKVSNCKSSSRPSSRDVDSRHHEPHVSSPSSRKCIGNREWSLNSRPLKRSHSPFVRKNNDRPFSKSFPSPSASQHSPPALDVPELFGARSSRDQVGYQRGGFRANSRKQHRSRSPALGGKHFLNRNRAPTDNAPLQKQRSGPQVYQASPFRRGAIRSTQWNEHPLLESGYRHNRMSSAEGRGTVYDRFKDGSSDNHSTSSIGRDSFRDRRLIPPRLSPNVGRLHNFDMNDMHPQFDNHKIQGASRMCDSIRNEQVSLQCPRSWRPNSMAMMRESRMSRSPLELRPSTSLRNWELTVTERDQFTHLRSTSRERNETNSQDFDREKWSPRKSREPFGKGRFSHDRGDEIGGLFGRGGQARGPRTSGAPSLMKLKFDQPPQPPTLPHNTSLNYQKTSWPDWHGRDDSIVGRGANYHRAQDLDMRVMTHGSVGNMKKSPFLASDDDSVNRNKPRLASIINRDTNRSNSGDHLNSSNRPNDSRKSDDRFSSGEPGVGNVANAGRQDNAGGVTARKRLSSPSLGKVDSSDATAKRVCRSEVTQVDDKPANVKRKSNNDNFSVNSRDICSQRKAIPKNVAIAPAIPPPRKPAIQFIPENVVIVEEREPGEIKPIHLREEFRNAESLPRDISMREASRVVRHARPIGTGVNRLIDSVVDSFMEEWQPPLVVAPPTTAIKHATALTLNERFNSSAPTYASYSAASETQTGVEARLSSSKSKVGTKPERTSASAEVAMPSLQRAKVASAVETPSITAVKQEAECISTSKKSLNSKIVDSTCQDDVRSTSNKSGDKSAASTKKTFTKIMAPKNIPVASGATGCRKLPEAAISSSSGSSTTRPKAEKALPDDCKGTALSSLQRNSTGAKDIAKQSPVTCHQASELSSPTGISGTRRGIRVNKKRPLDVVTHIGSPVNRIQVADSTAFPSSDLTTSLHDSAPVLPLRRRLSEISAQYSAETNEILARASAVATRHSTSSKDTEAVTMEAAGSPDEVPCEELSSLQGNSDRVKTGTVDKQLQKTTSTLDECLGPNSRGLAETLMLTDSAESKSQQAISSKAASASGKSGSGVDGRNVKLLDRGPPAGGQGEGQGGGGGGSRGQRKVVGTKTFRRPSDYVSRGTVERVGLNPSDGGGSNTPAASCVDDKEAPKNIFKRSGEQLKTPRPHVEDQRIVGLSSPSTTRTTATNNNHSNLPPTSIKIDHMNISASSSAGLSRLRSSDMQLATSSQTLTSQALHQSPSSTRTVKRLGNVSSMVTVVSSTETSVAGSRTTATMSSEVRTIDVVTGFGCRASLGRSGAGMDRRTVSMEVTSSRSCYDLRQLIGTRIDSDDGTATFLDPSDHNANRIDVSSSARSSVRRVTLAPSSDDSDDNLSSITNQHIDQSKLLHNPRPSTGPARTVYNSSANNSVRGRTVALSRRDRSSSPNAFVFRNPSPPRNSQSHGNAFPAWGLPQSNRTVASRSFIYHQQH